MTKPELSIQYNRLVGQYGLPHNEGKLNTVNANEWWERFRSCDIQTFTAAVTKLLEERQYKSFPSVGEMRQYISAVGGETVVDNQALSQKEQRLFAQYREIDRQIYNLPPDEKDALRRETEEAIKRGWWDGLEDHETPLWPMKPLCIAALTPFAAKLVMREIYARKNNLRLDFKSGLLDAPVTSRNISGITENPDERKEVVPVNPNQGKNPFVTKGGGRVFEKPAQRYQPQEDPWEEELPF